MQDLGCMNGWSQTDNPGKDNYEKLDKCYKEDHKVTCQNLGRCYNRYTCDICQTTYTVDSSDQYNEDYYQT